MYQSRHDPHSSWKATEAEAERYIHTEEDIEEASRTQNWKWWEEVKHVQADDIVKVQNIEEVID